MMLLSGSGIVDDVTRKVTHRIFITNR